MPLFVDSADTARWIAAYRARESARGDALFHDPYARELAGARGEQIVRAAPPGVDIGWMVAVRTRAFDELIQKTVERDRVGVVLNLGAGLDTRAYRLPLPTTLRWVEVDHAGLLADKDRILAGERPRCQRETVALDLADPAARCALFSRINMAERDVLVVTEGLLLYQSRNQVASLARELSEQPHFRLWLIDVLTPAGLNWFLLTWGVGLAAAGIRPQFAPAEGLAFFEARGWGVREFRSRTDEAHRLGRQPPLVRLSWQPFAIWPTSTGQRFRPVAGYALLDRASEADPLV